MKKRVRSFRNHAERKENLGNHHLKSGQGKRIQKTKSEQNTTKGQVSSMDCFSPSPTVSKATERYKKTKSSR